MRNLSPLAILVSVIIIISILFLSACSSPSTPSTAPTPSSSIPATSSTSAPTSTAAKEPIKIGFITTTSGMFASVDKYVTPAVQMAIDNVNKSGGLLGMQIQLVARDDTGDPSLVTQKANELVAAGCVGILGAFLDTTEKALTTWAGTSKVLVVGVSSALVNERTTDFTKYSFHTAPITLATSSVISQEIVKQNDVNSIVFINAEMGVNHDFQDQILANLAQIKPQVKNLGTTWINKSETEFSNIISATLAKNPDMIFAGEAGPAWVAFVQQGQRFGLFDKTKVIGCYLLGADATTPFGSNYPQGIQTVTWSPFWLNEQPMQDFVKSFYTISGGLYPGDITMRAYIATLGMMAAIKQANSTETDKMINALENLDFNTPLGTLHYRDFDHQLNMPIWYCTTGYTKDYPISIGITSSKHQDDVYPTKDQILQLRAAK
jgi:branched-chain amino acid transport system substrate-binding protein